MIRHLAVDMDGTCLGSKSRMSEKTVGALRLAAEKGIIVVPTTGRNLLYFLHPKAKENAEKMLNEFDSVSYAYSNTYVEIFDKNASKGIALSKLAEHLGIEISEIACIGDGENDLTMFASSGTKLAMGNAVDALKEKADFILPDNDSDGVAYAIEKYVI